MRSRLQILAGLLLVCMMLTSSGIRAQTAPSGTEEAVYSGLHSAAARGDIKQIRRLVSENADIEVRDSFGRTPLHVAVFKSDEDIVRALAKSGADMNAYEHDRYDVLTIAAVENDLEMVRLVLSLGGNSRNITSRYDGTALIAAAHLGNFEVVRALVNAGAPLNHINNLDWTALIEAVVLGDGGARHVETARILIEAGADITIADGEGVTPLAHAKQRGYADMVALFPKSAK